MAKPSQPAEPQRIAKLLARAGIGSRRDVERFIAEGRIALNGKTVLTPATLLATTDGITFDGQPVRAAEPTRLWFLHKPAGCVTTARDPQGRKTVFDLLPAQAPRMVSVGRLDFTTEGLLLLTNDGELKRWLELPVNAVERRYRVRVRGTVTQAMLEALAEGVTIEGIRYGSIIADIEHKSGLTSWVSVVLTEGKNREIRRVMEYLGVGVSRLIRTGYGPFDLNDLPPGALVEAPAAWLSRVKDRSGRIDVASAWAPPRPSPARAPPRSPPPKPRQARADDVR
ncbi:rRNA pseudouridine synthase [Hankyongella ginsenosidimutans]|uniref:Pseudouridine synthase n=1 Tax=Hankyongella ginsenosidimutans TaxID=1763828 RepID=A0A4D7C5T8_9SPHN|nr:pseudouridine synthase [Hankyongella ginsenosidimutans]QCI79080.1 rRNA pseudouridine synthase [Hankyongella ginsenosidimutans]